MPVANFSYPASAAAVVFGVHLSTFVLNIFQDLNRWRGNIRRPRKLQIECPGSFTDCESSTTRVLNHSQIVKAS